MPRPYSGDLRRRVVAAALDERQSRGSVARRFAVGRSTVYRWVEAAREEGRLEAKPMRGGPEPTIRDASGDALKRLVTADNHLTLAEYRDRLAAEVGVRVHPGRWAGPSSASGSRAKKKTLRAAERDEAEIAAEREGWREATAGIAPARLVFLDESAALTNLTRTHARSPRGERARGSAPGGRWERVTILGALGVEGIVAAMGITAATDGAVFHAYLERVLLPELRRVKPDAVLVMDNLGAHKAEPVRELLAASGFAYRYLPRYSPDLNPIEPAWAKVKSLLRKAAARTVDGLHAALGPALDTITAQDARGFFRHAGYDCPN